MRLACLLLLTVLAGCGDDTPSGTPDAAPLPPDAAPVGQGDEARGDVAINEIASKPAAGPDWIELYARGSSAVDLSGWYLTDGPDRLDHFYQFPAGTVLAPGAYLIVYADNGAAGAGHHARFELSREDGAYLLDPDGTAIDSLLYLGATDGRSLARSPSGEGRFFFSPETPAAVNP